MIYHGDCLEIIPKIGKFDLIYCDPPFATGQVQKRKGGSYDDAQSVDALLDLLDRRLCLMWNALNTGGSLWLHLDYRAVHDAKVLCDGIFNRSHFAGEIVWVPGNAARGKGFSHTHQTLLVWCKGERTWNHEREPYADTSLAMHFKETDGGGRRYRDRTVNGKTYRYYADDGRKLGSVWLDCPAMVANSPIQKETTGYPTQKPLKLLSRIVSMATNEGERVLDPMCGSGTAIVAAKKLGREAVGVDRNEEACSIAFNRVQ